MNYLPATDQDKREMLEKIGVSSTEELFKHVPSEVRLKRPLHIHTGLSEYEVLRKMTTLSNKNKTTSKLVSFLGAGAYEHYQPLLVGQLISRSEFFTAYTPYQAEISQGTLQAIYEYQTCVCEIFGMDVANASVYDGSVALAEAINMATDKKHEVILTTALNPEYTKVVETYCHGYGVKVNIAKHKNGLSPVEVYEPLMNKNVGAIVVQYPNFFGNVDDLKSLADFAHANGALLIVAICDVAAMGLLEAPGKLGADIVAAEGMSFAGPLQLSGPSLGMMATTNKLVRKLPGRIIGKTVDSSGNPAFVLTLQAREQHIRREKASSNICSNQGLNAMAACITMVTLGKQGLQVMAERSAQKAHYCYQQLLTIPGVEPVFDAPFFDEFLIKLPKDVSYVNKCLLDEGILGGCCLDRFLGYYPELENVALYCVTELRTKSEIDNLVNKLGVILHG